MEGNNSVKLNSVLDLVNTRGAVGIYKEVLSGERTQFPRGFWKLPDAKEYANECIRYLLETELQLLPEEFCTHYTLDLVRKYRLLGMHAELFKGKHLFYELDSAYPDRFKPWEFKSVWTGFWTDETCAEAVRWLIEEKLHLTREEICTKWSQELLYKHGLVVIATKYSVFDILNLVYPNEFKPWEFQRVPKKYWTRETSVESLRWLFTEKYAFDHAFVVKNLSSRFLLKESLLSICNYGTLYSLINEAFPNEFEESEFIYYTEMRDEAVRLRKLINNLGWTDEETYVNCSVKFLIDNDFSVIRRRASSPFRLLDMAFPRKFDFSTWRNYHTS